MTPSPVDGMKFPRIDAKTLAGRELSFPTAFVGKKTLLILVFEHRGRYQGAQAQANNWITTWNKNPQTRSLILYEIPMMSRFYRIAQNWIDQAMQGGLNKAQHDFIACYYGGRNKYIRALNIGSLDEAYLFLLDEEGFVLHQASGDCTREKIIAFLNYL